MGCRRSAWTWMLLVWCTAGVKTALAQPMADGTRPVTVPRPTGSVAQGFLPAPVPLDQLEPAARERVRAVLEHPTLSSRGPLEAFRCRPALYFWLLDHPDQAV